MDRTRFDDLTRFLATRGTRRGRPHRPGRGWRLGCRAPARGRARPRRPARREREGCPCVTKEKLTVCGGQCVDLQKGRGQLRWLAA